ncbi:hypothetical protein [Leptobacterium sp. I13]|uniref:hypothetical protein n=1 Tax=Leptobacterium meishanense TaxID=3128904 RepID=UPI0030ED5ADC
MKTRVYKYILVFGMLFFILISCEGSKKIDIDQEKEKILELHNLQRKYHFEKMVKEFLDQNSNDFISVNNGVVSTPTKEEMTTRFTKYFNAVEFEKWDDINPPVIRFSDDYSMAYTVVNKEVVVKYQNAEGIESKQKTEFSWVAIYKKYSEEGWKLDCITSTNKPSSTEVIEN